MQAETDEDKTFYRDLYAILGCAPSNSVNYSPKNSTELLLNFLYLDRTN